MYTLGIDGGGTKTTGLLVDEDGNVQACATVGASNPQGTEPHELEAVIASLLSEIREQATASFAAVGRVFAGFAGADREPLKRSLTGLLKRHLPPQAEVEVDHDGVNALYAGTLGEAGVVHIAGTGSLAFGVNERGERGRVGGWGYVIGDAGSGFAIGLAALKAAFRAFDRREPKTRLTERILQHLQVPDVPDMVAKIYEAGRTRTVVASLCRAVMEAADEGDPGAADILREAGRDMADSILALMDKLFGESERQGAAIPVVLSGGVYRRSEWFVPHIEAALTGHRKHVRLIVPELPPVAGAVFAARKTRGAGPAFAERLLRTLHEKRVNGE